MSPGGCALQIDARLQIPENSNRKLSAFSWLYGNCQCLGFTDHSLNDKIQQGGWGIMKTWRARIVSLSSFSLSRVVCVVVLVVPPDVPIGSHLLPVELTVTNQSIQIHSPSSSFRRLHSSDSCWTVGGRLQLIEARCMIKLFSPSTTIE